MIVTAQSKIRDRRDARQRARRTRYPDGSTLRSGLPSYGP